MIFCRQLGEGLGSPSFRGYQPIKGDARVRYGGG
jgi:hypothetical protein